MNWHAPHLGLPMNNLLAIRVFARVVETGGFTKAADSLGIPLATASKLIQDLEAELRVKLLQRTTRIVAVTPEGAAYYDRTLPIMQALDEINSSFAIENANPAGTIRIGISASLASSFLIPALPRFHARYPNVEVDLCVRDSFTDMIQDGIDCAIRGGPMLDESLVAREVGRAGWTTCASPEYVRRYGIPSSIDDLERNHKLVRYISPRTGRIVPSPFGVGTEAIEVQPNAFLSVNEGNAHLAAGLAGVGVIHIFTFKVRPYIATGQLVPFLDGLQPPPYPFHVVYPRNRHLSQRLRIFIDWLAEMFGELDFAEQVS
jgi:LysR family transcriptional regulator for bpeEF and oprC